MKRLIDQKLIDWAKSLANYLYFDDDGGTGELGGSWEVETLTILDSIFMPLSIYFQSSINNITYNEVDDEYIMESNNFAIHFHGDSKDIEALTNKNVKTLFGNQSIYGSGNIDLYRHQLQFKDGSTLYFAEIISSSNLNIDSLQDLTTLTKATTNYKIVLYNEADAGANDILIYSGSIWEYDIAGEAATFTTISDVVTTI